MERTLGQPEYLWVTDGGGVFVCVGVGNSISEVSDFFLVGGFGEQWDKRRKDSVGVLLCSFVAIVCGIGLFKSYSRGAWLATGVGIGYLIFQFQISPQSSVLISQSSISGQGDFTILAGGNGDWGFGGGAGFLAVSGLRNGGRRDGCFRWRISMIFPSKTEWRRGRGQFE